MPSFRLVPCAALLSSLLFTAGLTAQIPEGHALIATSTDVGVSGTPGLFVVPLGGAPNAPITPITGLPAVLTTSSAFLQGALEASIRSSDGALIVTTLGDPLAPNGGDHDLFIFHLNGLAVIPALTQQIVLGTAAAVGGSRHALLPDGRILVHAVEVGPTAGAVFPLSSGPMANHFWAIVDTSGPTPGFTLLPNPPGVAGQEYASICVDPAGQYVYYTLSFNFFGQPANMSLLRLDLATGIECTIANFPGESAFGVVCDDDGTVYVSSTNPSAISHFMHTVVPNGCNPASVTSVQSSLPLLTGSLDLDRASGEFVITSYSGVTGFAGSQQNRASTVDPATGLVTVIAPPLPGGWGTVRDVTVNNAIESYGVPTDAQNRHWFENFPNPTGIPFVGNNAFSMTMASAPGSAVLSAMSLSFGRSSTNIFGIEYLLDPAAAVTTIVPSGTSVPYALAIPNDPGFAGVKLRAQSLHLETGNVVAASRGLEFVIGLHAAPTISSVSPSAPLPGATVTVDGYRFYNGLELRVAGVLTPIVTQTQNSLTFVMPSGVACNSLVSLTNIGGNATTAFVNATPVITFSTSGGPAAGNQLLVITGQYLDNATVTLNGVPLTSFLVQTSTSIVGYTPPGTPGPATLVIASPTGCQASTIYNYQ